MGSQKGRFDFYMNLIDFDLTLGWASAEMHCPCPLFRTSCKLTLLKHLYCVLIHKICVDMCIVMQYLYIIFNSSVSGYLQVFPVLNDKYSC